MITIEDKPYNTTIYTAGMYIDDSGEEYECSIIEHQDSNMHTVEVIWCNSHPTNPVGKENEIIEQYQSNRK